MKEKEIEQYLYENPGAVKFSEIYADVGTPGHIDYWISRQYDIPSGIIDLFGVDNKCHFVVVEVKRGPIDAKALSQVCRYAADMKEAISCITGITSYEVKKVIVGKTVNEKVLTEARSLGVCCAVIDLKTDTHTTPKTVSQQKDRELWNKLKNVVLDQNLRDEIKYVQEVVHGIVTHFHQMAAEIDGKNADVSQQVENLLEGIEF